MVGPRSKSRATFRSLHPGAPFLHLRSAIDVPADRAHFVPGVLIPRHRDRGLPRVAARTKKSVAQISVHVPLSTALNDQNQTQSSRL